MQTPEEILTNKGLAYEYNQIIVVTPVSHVKEVFQPLLTELHLLRFNQQTLLDEVNRLNGIIEKVSNEVESFHTLYDKCKNIRKLIK